MAALVPVAVAKVGIFIGTGGIDHGGILLFRRTGRRFAGNGVRGGQPVAAVGQGDGVDQPVRGGVDKLRDVAHGVVGERLVELRVEGVHAAGVTPVGVVGDGEVAGRAVLEGINLADAPAVQASPVHGVVVVQDCPWVH